MNPLNLRHVLITTIIVGIAIAIFIGVALVLEQVDEALLIGWLIIGSLLAIVILAYAIVPMKPNILYLVSFLDDIWSVYSPLQGGKRGLFGTGFILRFPPVISRVTELPTSQWEIFIKAKGFVTETIDKKKIPVAVLVFMKFVFRFSHDLQGLRVMAQRLDIMNQPNLAQPVRDGMNSFEFDHQSAIVTEGTYYPPKLVELIQSILQGAVGEAVSRVVPARDLVTTQRELGDVEKSMFVDLATRTSFKDAELLSDNPAQQYRGRATDFVDFNLEFVRYESDDAHNSLSAAVTARGLADAESERGRGREEYLKKVKTAGVDPNAALGADVLQGHKGNLDIIATDSVLDALVKAVVKKKP